MPSRFIATSVSLYAVLTLLAVAFQPARAQISGDHNPEFFAGDSAGVATLVGPNGQEWEVTYALYGTEAIFQGDIVLHDFANQPKTRGLVIGSLLGIGPLWPGGVIPYQISSSLPNPTRVTDAIAHWEANTGINFVPYNSSVHSDWVIIQRGTGSCRSPIGQTGGFQLVYITDDCSYGSVVHELGHTIGLWHEQSRADRDRYVNILWDSIPDSIEFNYEKHVLDGVDIGSYNYESIMHYSAGAGIETIPAGIPIGQRDGLSQGDIDAVQYAYGWLSLTAPTLSFPADSQIVQDLTPQLFWNDVPAAARYRIELVNLTTGAPPEISTGFCSTAGLCSKDYENIPLTESNWYKWRVRGIVPGDEGPWSSWRTFVVNLDPYEFNDTPATSTYIASPFESIRSKILPAGDADWFNFYGAPGDTITVEIDTTNDSQLVFELTIYDSQMQRLRSVGLATTAQLSQVIPKTGYYYLKINAHFERSRESLNVVNLVGEYRLRFSRSKLDGSWIRARALLEGAYDDTVDRMSNTIRTLGQLPLTQPFTADLYDGTDLDFDSLESVTALPDSAVDWVLVSLRTDTSSTTEVPGTRHAALISKAGNLETPGIGVLRFYGISGDASYYLVVQARNHLDIMSANPVSLEGGAGYFDFTTSQNQAYGPDAQTELETGVWGMMAGDPSGDGQVTATDFNLWLVETKSAATGYVTADLNYDGQVTAADFNIWLVATKVVASSNVP